MSIRARYASWLLVAAPLWAAAQPPKVASINLCTDQLLLTLAAPGQILSLSWLSADPEESMLPRRASRYPLNYGSAEEILVLDPDIVLGGEFTSAFTRGLLEELGFDVVTVAPANSIRDIERNLRIVGSAIGREDEAERTIMTMRERAGVISRSHTRNLVPAIVVRPGGFTVGAGTLADDLMRLAGLRNIAAEGGLDAWGSLSLESLISSRPQLLIFTGYRRDAPSLANEILVHPALRHQSTGLLAASIEAPAWSCGIPASLESAAALVRAVAATKPTTLAAESENSDGISRPAQ